MSTAIPRVVIVGASLAGLQAAQTIQRGGFDGEIVLVGNETHYPYDRPPLSKQFLAGGWDEDKLRLRGAKEPDEFGFIWRLGQRAVGLDLTNRQVLLSSEPEGPAQTLTDAKPDRLRFSGLIIATGARPRTLPGCELAGVHVLRSLDDARALKNELGGSPKNVSVIGAGFIGAEVAATAKEMGHSVTLIEAADAPLARVLDRAAGDAIAELHRSNGVDVRLGVGVKEIVGAAVADGEVAFDGDPTPDGVQTIQQGTRVSGIQLEDGSFIDSDVVVVGIGVVPNTEWLEGSGLALDNGVLADEHCSVHPGIFAAGDVARWPHPRYGGATTRVEQWDNAVDQGGYVGRSMNAWLEAADKSQPLQEPYAPTPWFWSDQYDRKIQLAGIPTTKAEIVHGTLAEQRFVQIYSNDAGEFVGAMAWNRPRHAIKARQLLTKNGTIEEARELLA